MEINKYVDHTILKADAKTEDIKRMCDEAKSYNFASVCVNPANVKFVHNQLKGTKVKTCAVVGFPLGANTEKTKVFEATQCIKDGADEIDMVINIGAFKDGNFDRVYKEIKAIKKACGNKILKVIIETCFLSDEEKTKACELVLKAQADFVKTSTGFGTGGATFDDIKLMENVIGDNAEIKASGGIRDFKTATKYIELGATRLGTSSGVKIMEGQESEIEEIAEGAEEVEIEDEEIEEEDY